MCNSTEEEREGKSPAPELSLSLCVFFMFGSREQWKRSSHKTSGKSSVHARLPVIALWLDYPWSPEDDPAFPCRKVPSLDADFSSTPQMYSEREKPLSCAPEREYCGKMTARLDPPPYDDRPIAAELPWRGPDELCFCARGCSEISCTYENLQADRVFLLLLTDRHSSGALHVKIFD